MNHFLNAKTVYYYRMRSNKSYIIGFFLGALLSVLSNDAYAQLFREVSQSVRITATIVEGIAVGPCSFDPNQVCTNEDEYGSFGLGSFGIRIIGNDERPSISRAIASITPLSDLKVPALPAREQQTAQVWDKRL